MAELEVQEVMKRFGEVLALKAARLRGEVGRFFAVVGPNEGRKAPSFG